MAPAQQLGWIGIDVGTHTVKLAQTVRDGARVRLHRAAVIQRPVSWRGEDALAMEQTISSSPEISAALECGEFVGRNAICSLPMNVCQLRGLKVPPGSDQERRTIIADELAEDWAELRNPMEFDFWEMESTEADKGSDAFNVSVLAASRHWISQLWRDCRRSGLDCWAVDGLPLTIARAVALAGGTSGGRRTLAIDWGYSNTTLCVVGDARPLYTRRIHECSFGRVLEAIMDAFEVTLDEAQHLADTQGLTAANGVGSFFRPESSASMGRPPVEKETRPPRDEADPQTQAALTDAASASLDELVRQIGRTMHFTEAQRRHLQPVAIWLMGGGASMRNAGPYLSRALGLPVHHWKLPANDVPDVCVGGQRCALFGPAAALSAAAWRAA